MVNIGIDVRKGLGRINSTLLGILRVLSLESNEVHVISDLDSHSFDRLFSQNDLNFPYTHLVSIPECHHIVGEAIKAKYVLSNSIDIVIDDKSCEEILGEIVPKSEPFIGSNPFEKAFGCPVSPFLKGRVMSEAALLLKELKERFLDVTLIPAPDPRHHGHMIRIATNSNPQWYRELFQRLDVKRDRIISSLERVSRGAPSNKSSYDLMFIEEIRSRLIEGFTNDDGKFIPPHDDIIYELYGDDFTID